MLYPYTVPERSEESWRRINMRKVSHLLGAEMLHNLYNRHWPRINSLRFRHTIVNYKDGIVDTYAPISEWGYLQKWLSKKFINNDQTLITEIHSILSPSYKRIDALIDLIKGYDLEKISDETLALSLIDIMNLPIGEIYKLNVVQIEYSLNYAICQILEKYEPSEVDRNELLSMIIAPGELTVAQNEEVAFGRIIKLGRKLGVQNAANNDRVGSVLKNHYDKFAPLHCAYGELPPTFEDYIIKYSHSIESSDSPTTLTSAKNNVNKKKKESINILNRIGDPSLIILCDLMAKIGVFRDKNKAKLGETVAIRFRLINEIHRRTNVAQEDLANYLLSELVQLIDTGVRVDKSVIQERVDNGVSFRREEDMHTGVYIFAKRTANESIPELSGICASKGQTRGIAKIVTSKNDIKNFSKGDIMVAVGTDFDLIEIMNLSSGIITEEGGLLSHASVVSREMGKPCLIGAHQATTALRNGQPIYLDASAGKVITE